MANSFFDNADYTALPSSLYSTIVTSYADGLTIEGKAPAAATGAATLNHNTLGAIAISRPDRTAIQTDDWAINDIVVLKYNSTLNKFILQSATLGIAVAAAASATAAAASETAAAASETAAAASATAAATAETNAELAETNAATSATNAATSATTATTQATNAAASATTATTQATTATTQATNAATSA